MAMKRENPRASFRPAAPQRLDDEDLGAVSGAGKAATSKAGTSKSDLPVESLSLNYTSIQWSY